MRLYYQSITVLHILCQPIDAPAASKKQPDNFDKILQVKMGEMLFKRLPTTLLQIFSKNILNSKVIVKSFIYPDNNSLMNSCIYELIASLFVIMLLFPM